MKLNMGGFDMQIAAEEESVVAVFGNSFPYEQSWLENIALVIADTLGLDKREAHPTSLYFEEERLVGARKFSAEKPGLRLSYDKSLPSYNADGENTESQAAMKALAELVGSDAPMALALAAKYFRKGPFQETLAVYDYYPGDGLDEKARVIACRYALLKDGEVGLSMQVGIGVDCKSLADFVAHLGKAETPLAEPAREELEERECGELPAGVARKIETAYLKPPVEEFEGNGYGDKLAELISYVTEF